jgi:hypothetical protein
MVMALPYKALRAERQAKLRSPGAFRPIFLLAQIVILCRP